MKAPAFDYAKAPSVAAAIELLQRNQGDARLLAGGQTLLATLNMRLSEPALLIDIGGLDELRGISVSGAVLRIGALETHSAIERSALVGQHLPLLAQAAPHIAHRAIRNRGTLGGSLAYADPAAEWPACALALDAVLVARGPSGERRIPAAGFFVGLFQTALADNELLVACEFPLPGPGRRQHFDELARRHGDYAIAGLAAATDLNDGLMSNLRLAFLAVAERPMRATQTEQLLEGRRPDDDCIAEAERVLGVELAPEPDPANSAATKRHLAKVLLRRALRRLSS